MKGESAIRLSDILLFAGVLAAVVLVPIPHNFKMAFLMMIGLFICATIILYSSISIWRIRKNSK